MYEYESDSDEKIKGDNYAMKSVQLMLIPL